MTCMADNATRFLLICFVDIASFPNFVDRCFALKLIELFERELNTSFLLNFLEIGLSDHLHQRSLETSSF